MTPPARLAQWLLLFTLAPAGLVACGGADGADGIDGAAQNRPKLEAPACPYDLEERMDLPPLSSWAVDIVTAQCMTSPVAIAPDGQADCVVLDLRPTTTCACDPALGLRPVPAEDQPALAQATLDGNVPAGSCACEVTRIVAAEDRATCETHSDSDGSSWPAGANGDPLQGWCYVDPGAYPPRGNPELVETCPDYAKRLMRFEGATGRRAKTDKTLVILCRSATSQCSGLASSPD